MTLSSERRAYEKAVLKDLSVELKGTPWKKNQNAIYCVSGEFYIDVSVNVHLNRTTTVASMSVKPMSLDRVYWRITNLNDNNLEPLSFRTWGAFTCSGLPMNERSFVDEELTSDELAKLITDWADRKLSSVLSRLSGKSFSEELSQHPNQIDHGAYAISYVTSLIDEGNIDRALQTARSYLDGSLKSVHSQTHLGKDFHELALKWIDSSETVKS